MDEPSMSELETKYNDLLWQINNLELGSAPPPPPDPDGAFIPAGTIISCRPSRAAAMIERLGGEENVAIVDTADTEGFARGKHKDAAPWTNEVYPTNIGPSCAGITSDMTRVSAPPTNGCITVDNWNPALMFDAGKGISGLGGEISQHFYTISRVFYFSSAPDMTPRKFTSLFKADSLFGYGSNYDPYFSGNPNINKNQIYSTTETYTSIFSISNESLWMNTFGQSYPLLEFPIDDNTGLLDTEWTFTWNWAGRDYEFKIVDPNALYIIVSDYERDDYYLKAVEAREFGVPYKISIFSINANVIDNAAPTPVIKYGGYDRKNPPGTGPTPRWNRTNLVQLKILRDVTIEA